ncbi:hypothetical protein JOF36_000443 [Pseudonocardia parietis]|uniref:Uncharacterized protein n=1 Tax=Pseudonocardia parietis TaxID=570936 RepID=A0ABS4VLF5_9PSEU|nr:hypothetical protein [Pseudonocardia parietis]
MTARPAGHELRGRAVRPHEKGERAKCRNWYSS